MELNVQKLIDDLHVRLRELTNINLFTEEKLADSVIIYRISYLPRETYYCLGISVVPKTVEEKSRDILLGNK